MVKILVSLIVAVMTLIEAVYLERPTHDPFRGWHPIEDSPDSVQTNGHVWVLRFFWSGLNAWGRQMIAMPRS